jgi:hypothetical protein
MGFFDMPFTAEISRTNPSCFLFLVDQSSSMNDVFGPESGQSKAQGVADALNKLVQTLVLRCAKAEGIRDYFHVGVIGYGNRVGPVLGVSPLNEEPQPMMEPPPSTPVALDGDPETIAKLVKDVLRPISAVANKPLRVETRSRQIDDGAGGQATQKVKFPVWLEPAAYGATPMCEAIDFAWHVLNDFLCRYPGCYPPAVINITDGEATDGDPEPHAGCIRDLSSTDGRVLLFNSHVSSLSASPIQFPDREAGLADAYAQALFRMSSNLPQRLINEARKEGYPVSEISRGYVFNANLAAVIRFLDIGTRVSQNLR